MPLPATLHESTTKQNVQLQKQKTREIQQRRLHEQHHLQRSQPHPNQSPPQQKLHPEWYFYQHQKHQPIPSQQRATQLQEECHALYNATTTSFTKLTTSATTNFATAKWKNRCYVVWRHRTMTRILISNYAPAHPGEK